MNIHLKYLFVLFASVVLAACGQTADDTAKDAATLAPDTAKDAATFAPDQEKEVKAKYVNPRRGMVLAATTSSDAARKHYMKGWAAYEMSRFNAANEHFKTATKTEAPAEVDRSVPADIRGKVYFLGGSTYNPRAFQNISQWDRMVDMLAKAGDKGVSGLLLAASLTINEKHPEKAHFNFVSYLERRGALIHKAKA